MNADELRIGNYLELLGKIVKVEGISNLPSRKEMYWIACNAFEDTKIIHFKPIELTEEWHNKFGVVRDGFNQFQYNTPRKNNFNVDIIFTGDYVYIRQRTLSSRPSHNDDLISIWNRDLTKRDMYVHEWQNLYFSLTGEELTNKKII